MGYRKIVRKRLIGNKRNQQSVLQCSKGFHRNDNFLKLTEKEKFSSCLEIDYFCLLTLMSNRNEVSR